MIKLSLQNKLIYYHFPIYGNMGIVKLAYTYVAPGITMSSGTGKL